MQDWSALPTHERVEAVRPLVLDGLSASQIAGMFTNCTRNAVIGVVQRHLVKHGVKLANSQMRAAPRVRRDRPTQPNVQRIRRRREAEPVIAVDPVEHVHDADDGVDVTHLIGIMQLTERTCRWPVGDPLLPGFGYCGAAVLVRQVNGEERRSRYCPDHDHQAFAR